MRLILATLCLFFFCNSVVAQPIRQTANLVNTWLMYFGDHKVSDRWGIHLEAQWRRSEVLSKPQQLLFRPALNYHINAQTFLSAGYCFVETNPYGQFPVKATFPEHRLWQQMQVKNQLGRFEMVNRFRLEQRWLQLPVQKGTVFVPGDAVYQNRFRILSRFSLPFKGKIIGDRSWYLSMYDEVFISFGEKVGYNIFDQNRWYLAVGYKIPKLGKLELGYLSQVLNKANGIQVENNHTIQIGLSSTVDFYRKNK